jgi:hypothetical protein
MFQCWTRFRRPCLGIGVNFEDPRHILVWVNLLFVSFSYIR